MQSRKVFFEFQVSSISALLLLILFISFKFKVNIFLEKPNRFRSVWSNEMQIVYQSLSIKSLSKFMSFVYIWYTGMKWSFRKGGNGRIIQR